MSNLAFPLVGPAARDRPAKRLLNAGSGAGTGRPAHALFAGEHWQETRLDIEATVKPDVVGSITGLGGLFAPRSFDAVWSSHVLEHLYVHEVPRALDEIRKVLKPDGFALITSPDVEAIAAFILDHGADHVAYISPAGPITAFDMLYGHASSLAQGHLHMAHKSGFTCALLGRLLVDAGFSTVLVNRERFDLWAVALMEEADEVAMRRELNGAGLGILCDAA